MTVKTNEGALPYSLSEHFIGGQTVEISLEQHAALKAALATLVAAMEVEELFQVFAQSFLRFEKDLLDIAFEHAFGGMYATGLTVFLSSARNRINVSILNILTCFKSYDDHCDRILKSLTDVPDAVGFNCESRAGAYNSHLSYQICAALRNYAQHRALPLGGFSVGGTSNIGTDSSGQIQKLDTGFSVSPWLDVVKFKDSSQCKAELRAKLECMGYGKIDIKWLIRSFAGAMYERHEKLREFLRPKVVAAGEEIAAGYEFASKKMNREAKYLQLCECSNGRSMRNDLAAKVLSNFKTCTSLKIAEWSYVTSQVTKNAATYAGSA